MPKPKRTARRNHLLVAPAGLIAAVLGAGLANADVQGALVEAIGEAQDPVVDVVEEQPGSDEIQVAGQLEADHAVPVVAEDEAKLDDEPDDVEDEDAEEPADPEPDDAGDDTTAAAVPAPDVDTDDDTDEGKTSIPLPGADDDTDAEDETDDAADAEDAETDDDD
jgi:hypothetical protein